MIQRHSIILWKKAEEENIGFEQISREAYDVMTIFQDYPLELRPNYLTAKSKKDVKEFEWDFEKFKELLKNGVNKENNIIFEELGYSLSFFSSFDSFSSSRISIRVGLRNQKFKNSLIIDLPMNFNVYEKKDAEMLNELFKRLVIKFKPFWGCVSNKVLSSKYGKFLEGDFPTMIHWINYWSENIINKIGKENILEMVEKNQGVLFENGIFLIKETALDINNTADMEFHSELEKQLWRIEKE